MNPKLLFLPLFFALSACAFDIPQDVRCSAGETRPDHVCVDGIWVVEEPGVLDDTGHHNSGDMSGNDAGGDAACTPETDEELCIAAGATCGALVLTDGCGIARTPTCGTCAAPLECGGGGTPNVCACPGSDDATACAQLGKNCGLLEAMDPTCGVVRSFNCGMCNAPATCGGTGTDNVCGCNETDEDFCARMNACGNLSATDVCGNPRTVDCGGCPGEERCGDGGVPNQCGCEVRRACFVGGHQCGDVDLSGICSNLGTESCGSCGSGTCNAQNMCECPMGSQYNMGSCRDINECQANTDNCDPNATCTNTSPGFSCACNDGFMGDGTTCTPISSGSRPSVAEVETATGSLVVTTNNMTGNANDVYFVFVSLRTSSRVVQRVDGMGLAWQQIAVECDGNGSQRLEVWGARGATAFTSPIAVTMNQTPFAAVVTAVRVTGVAASNSTGNIVSDNASTNNTCSNGQLSNTYSFGYSPSSNTLVLAGTATNGRSHSPGNNWNEIDEATETNGNNVAGLAVMTREGNGSNFNVSGGFNQSAYWATIALEVSGP